MYSFTSYIIKRSVLNRAMASEGLSMFLIAPLWPHNEFSTSVVPTGDGTLASSNVLDSASSNKHSEVSSGIKHETSCLEIISFLSDAGFSEKVSVKVPSHF